MTRWTMLGIATLMSLPLVVGISRSAHAQTEMDLQSAVFRAKPAVVMIGVEAAGSATVRCGAGEPVSVRPAPIAWIGSGSIVHPDGWVVTNGHVVQPFHEANEPKLGVELLERAVAQACPAALEGLGDPQRARRIRALAADPASRVTVEKRLQVTISNGVSHRAVIKHYSPPAYIVVGESRDSAGNVRKEFGKDVAILKIDGRDLPVVPLARRSSALNLGQPLFVIGFPAVVVQHELLSQATRFEPSVTVGRVSGFRQDVGGQRVIQTDAAIIQGNSGGPVFDSRGNVVGAATFTSVQGDQVVQGFNFAIPVETVHEALETIGVTPTGESAFTRLWNRGVNLYLRDLHARAYNNLEAASKIHPGFPDVERVKEDCILKYQELGYLHREWVQWTLTGGGLVVGSVGLWVGGRLAARRRRRLLRAVVREELARLGVTGLEEAPRR